VTKKLADAVLKFVALSICCLLICCIIIKMARVCYLLIVLLMTSTPLAQIQQRLDLTSLNGDHIEKQSEPSAETHKTALGTLSPEAQAFNLQHNVIRILEDPETKWPEKTFDISVEIVGLFPDRRVGGAMVGISTTKALIKCYWKSKPSSCYYEVLLYAIKDGTIAGIGSLAPDEDEVSK
jgi:hypothetical protein